MRAREYVAALQDVVEVMGRAGRDPQPVFDTIATNAVRLCDAEHAVVWLVEGDELVRAALAGEVTPQVEDTPGVAERLATTGPWLVARAVRAGSTVHIPDIRNEPEFLGRTAHEIALSRLAVPILRDGTAIGAIRLGRKDPVAFTPDQISLVESFAAQAAIAIENVRLFNETREALERQTATAEILRIISSSPTDLKPVLDVILTSAQRYCGAEDVLIHLREGDTLVASAHAGPIKSAVPLGRGPVPISRDAPPGLAVLERRTVHVADLQASDEFPVGQEIARRIGFRTALATPLLRGGDGIGAITLRRTVVRAFSEREIELLETFASQAAIAIENVRLFNETREALERQTAIGEILRAISGSPTEVQPVLDAIAANAARYCSAEDVVVALASDGQLWLRAHWGRVGTDLASWPLDRTSLSGRSAVEARTIHVADIQAAADEYSIGADSARRTGHRATLSAPLLRQGRVLGVLLLRRLTSIPFAQREVELAETFAAQAAIAIENVRLFNETKEALEQQRAVSEVLASIGRSAFDLPTLLGTVVERAARLCHAPHGIIYRLEGGVLRIVAAYQISEELRELNERVPLTPGDRGSLIGRVTAERRPVRIDDAFEDPEYRLRDHQRIGRLRSMLGVPLLRGDDVIGAMSLWRPEPVPFTDTEVGIVTTFADQAAIAMENVRLFNETREALDRQTAVSDILKVISASPTDIQPVLDAIASSAARFTGAEDASVLLARDDVAETRAHYGPINNPFSIPLDRGSVTGAAILDARLVHVADVTRGDEYPISKRLSLENDAQRTVLAAPLVREGKAIGAIVLRRKDDRGFTDRQTDLVRVFADQAVIAIENVRLFNETKEALEQQRAVAEVLQTISRSVFDLQPVLDTVVENTARLASADVALLSTSVGQDSFRVAALYGAPVQVPDIAALWADAQRDVARPADARSVMGRMLFERRVIHIEDLSTEPGLLEASVILRASGARTVLAVPMLRAGQPIGGVVVARLAVRRFSDREIELVQTFADQAAIAIQNTRLFSEIRDKSQQLELASRHKSEFLANMSHELRTPLNAIIGFSEVLLQGMFGELNEKQREYQEDVLSSGRHLLTLINDILDLSKIEAGRVELELGEFSLPEALENGVTMIRERAAKHGIRVQVDVAGVDRIVADERKVKQVVFNLLSNAVKFTPDGGRVDVSAARNNGEVRVAVRDTGIGIDEADRERIFEEFQQASRDPERSREGTGLGLALSKRYVELHGGRIWVESEVGRGSTFTFALPLLPARKEG